MIQILSTQFLELVVIISIAYIIYYILVWLIKFISTSTLLK